MTSVRLLDLGEVSAIRSQALYHAVAERAAPFDSPTLCMLYPDRPYVSIGYHQDAAREIDLAFCRERAIPVIRRRVGGGAVLLDSNQLFFHLVIPRDRLRDLGLSPRLDQRYARLVAPAVAAYAALGVSATLRPPNDIHVNGRKIGGTGMADIEDSLVFVGSMMLAFDHALMARVLRLAGESLREPVRRSIEEGVTSLEQLLVQRPRMESVREALLAAFRGALGVDLEPGALGEAEEAEIVRLEALFQSEDWLHRIESSPERPRKLVINGAVRFVEGKTPNGTHVALRVLEGNVDRVFVHRGGEADATEVAALTRRLIDAAV
jgi:lipoate-protein ligase A